MTVGEIGVCLIIQEDGMVIVVDVLLIAEVTISEFL